MAYKARGNKMTTFTTEDRISAEKSTSVTINVEPIPFAGMVTLTEPTEATITNKRYCTSCQIMRPADYGKMIKAGKINRWKCTSCFERISTPRYGRKAKEI
jgi:hypothetical protein